MLCAQGVKRMGNESGWGGNRTVMWFRNPLQEDPGLDQRDWSSIAPELFCLILHRVQERRGAAGEGRRIVACAGVCRSWRRQVYQFCHLICHTPYIQFPSSLSQPGPNAQIASGEAPVQCVLRRKGGVITLYHGEQRSFMLAARRKWKPAGCTFVISSHPRCFSQRGNTFMGKLKANFWGSEFVLWDAKPAGKFQQHQGTPLTGIYFSEDLIDGVRQRRIACVLVPPGQTIGCPDISLPFALPRSQSFSWSSCQCSSLPRSISKTTQAAQASFTRSVSTSTSIRVVSRSSSLPHPIAPVAPALDSIQGPQRSGQFLTACFSADWTLGNLVDMDDEVPDGETQYQMMLAAARRRKFAKFESLVTSARPDQLRREGQSNSVVALGSKIPEWDPHQHCWSLDFNGRASLPSIHNFQLVVDAFSGTARVVMEGLRRDGVVVLQLGKIGKGLYTMDYSFPLTAVQAFAICISSFSTSVGLDP